MAELRPSSMPATSGIEIFDWDEEPALGYDPPPASGIEIIDWDEQAAQGYDDEFWEH